MLHDIFNATLLNIFKNFVPNEMIIIDERDPPWITNAIKRKISQKSEFYKNLFIMVRKQ